MIDTHPRTRSPRRAARTRPLPRPIRAGSVCVLAVSGAGSGLTLAGPPLTQTRAALSGGTPWDALPLDLLLSGTCAAALVVCCLWLLAVTVATALETVSGVSSAAVRALTPRVVRRGVLLACGVAVGSAAVVGPATAASEAGQSGGLDRTAPTVLELDGLPLPDRPTGGLRDTPGRDVRSATSRLGAVHAAPDTFPAHRETDAALPPSARFRTATAATAEPRPRARYAVRPGDTLWSIARRLRPHGGLGEVDRTWRRVYRANRREIGADPDLLIPGTTLRLPVPPSGVRRLDGPSGPDPLPHRKDAS